MQKRSNLNSTAHSNKDAYFLITSHGQTATRWLATVLNTHPEIFCTHGYSYPPQAPDAHDLTHDEKTKIAEISAARFWKLSIHDFIYELKSSTSKKYIGNVHAYMYGYLMDSLKPWNLFNIQESLKIMNMVRHPVTRIESAFKCWSAGQTETSTSSFVDNDFYNRCTHITDYLSQKHNISYNVTERFFTVALLQAEDIAKDVLRAKNDDIFQVAFEDITTKTDTLVKIIQTISNGDLTLTTEQARSMLSTQALNKHNNNGRSSPAAQYEAWQPWQQDAFKFICEAHNLPELYSGFGYDFTFIK